MRKLSDEQKSAFEEHNLKIKGEPTDSPNSLPHFVGGLTTREGAVGWS